MCGAVYVRWIHSDNILSSTHYGGNESERFVQTFCARVDVYYDIGGSGNQTSVLNSLTTEHITFTAEEEDDVVMTIKLEPATKRFVERCVWMIAVGISLIVAIVAFAVMCFVKSQRRERKQVGM